MIKRGGAVYNDFGADEVVWSTWTDAEVRVREGGVSPNVVVRLAVQQQVNKREGVK